MVMGRGRRASSSELDAKRVKPWNMIRPDGTVEFDAPKVGISPFTLRDDFLASPLFGVSKPLNQNQPSSRYSFQSIVAGGELFDGDICFCSGSLYSMSLGSIRPEFGKWGRNSPDQERARHCFHKRLLEEAFGRPPDKRIARGPDERDADVEYNFAWGSVSAVTDLRDGDCDIFIKYVG
jgi:hypothetical protein